MPRRARMFHLPRPVAATRGRRSRISLVAIGLTPVLFAGYFVSLSAPDGLDDPNVRLTAGSEVTLIGHGHGHGRGMGQWGAFGYAKKGWTANAILSHFYGGTTAGKVDNPSVTVTLTGQNAVNVYADAGLKVGDRVVATGQAVILSGATATITSGCGGTAIDSVAATTVSPINAAPNRPANEWLKFCGSNDAYRGSIGLDGTRVVNVLSVDDYVKGVTPKESPPAWADQGGAEALKAQAIAARTYVLAAMNRGKAIDDTQNSQVYGGASAEDPRTNIAADATAGQILNGPDGKPAFTEFSSSTGGYSAGINFPAVVDDGDDIAPDHNWTASVSSASIASAFGVGALTDIAVVEANGLGADGGRALTVRISGTGGTVEATGDEVRTKLQLKSAWFTVQGQAPAKIVAPPAGVASAPPVPQLSVPGNGPTLNTINDLLKAATEAINDKFSSLGGATGSLGAIVGPVLALPGGTGAMRAFQRGMIYFSHSTGAHALLGEALTHFISTGAQFLHGLPTTDRNG